MQLKPEGKGINWSEIQMPGRTVKSLQNQWTAVNKKIDTIRQQQEQQDGDSAPVPVKKATRKCLVFFRRDLVVSLTTTLPQPASARPRRLSPRMMMTMPTMAAPRSLALASETTVCFRLLSSPATHVTMLTMPQPRLLSVPPRPSRQRLQSWRMSTSRRSPAVTQTRTMARPRVTSTQDKQKKKESVVPLACRGMKGAKECAAEEYSYLFDISDFTVISLGMQERPSSIATERGSAEVSSPGLGVRIRI